MIFSVLFFYIYKNKIKRNKKNTIVFFSLFNIFDPVLHHSFDPFISSNRASSASFFKSSKLLYISPFSTMKNTSSLTPPTSAANKIQKVEADIHKPGTLETAEKRKEALEFALAKFQLVLRDDSVLCRDFILNGRQAKISDLDQLVVKMCQAHYLHLYCNHELGHYIAHNTKTARRRKGSKYHADRFYRLLQRCVLLTTDLAKFPSTWPWMQNITPEAWREVHDLSEWILNFPEMPHSQRRKQSRKLRKSFYWV